jgi:phytoene/squalene synthetase
MRQLFDQTTLECSKLITNNYSTSFSLGIKSLHKKFHYPIYAIYGFVRYADEIVDTFHEYDKKALLAKFKDETYQAIEDRISFNPVLHAFQMVVNQYKIEHELIEAFLYSMEMDLDLKRYDQIDYEKYIYGSAEVVGLMCLRVFCEGDDQTYQQLKKPARHLGSAFQKVNFLRDIKDDYHTRGRIYFPQLELHNITTEVKETIFADIQEDFDKAYHGIINLPGGSKLGVYLAYIYYLNLFKKIKKTSVSRLLHERIRIPNFNKYLMLMTSYCRYRFNFW